MDAVTSLLADGPPDHPKLARLRGHLALNRQDGAEAVRWFRLSDAAEPNDGETLYGLAQALRVVGDRAAAEPYARRAEAQRVLRDHLTNLAANREPRPIVCCRLASDCESAGYLAEARAWYRLAIAYDPTNPQAQRALFRLNASVPAPGVAANPTSARPVPDRMERLSGQPSIDRIDRGKANCKVTGRSRLRPVPILNRFLREPTSAADRRPALRCGLIETARA